MKKISIIVPVYNTEKYIVKCLDSIIGQTYNNIEIIVVNDGSKDKSEEIILEYESKDNRIKYFKKENGGLSDARNFGVSKATGEYICFVDSDDYIDVNLFEKLSKYFNENYQLIKYKTIKVDEDGNEIERINGPIFENESGEQAFSNLKGQDVLLEAAWLYLIDLTFYKENNFKFLENTYHEDFGLLPLIITKAQNVISTDIYGYFYVQTNNSIVRNSSAEKNIKKAYDLFLHYDNMLKFIENFNISKNTKKQLKSYYTNAILLRIEKLPKEEQKKYIKEIKRRKLLKNIYITNFKQMIKKLILKINVKLYLKLR